jgi:antitoxin component YwqK of YwqJK toxin-antitoxin module
MEKFPKMKISKQFYEDEYLRVEMEGFIGTDHYQKLLIYGPNGELEEIYHFKNDRDHGLYQIFCEGMICQDGYYLDGKLHGKVSFYNDDGSVKNWEEYENGIEVDSSDGLTFKERLVNFVNEQKIDYKKLPDQFHKNFE